MIAFYWCADVCDRWLEFGLVFTGGSRWLTDYLYHNHYIHLWIQLWSTIFLWLTFRLSYGSRIFWLSYLILRHRGLQVSRSWLDQMRICGSNDQTSYYLSSSFGFNQFLRLLIQFRPLCWFLISLPDAEGGNSIASGWVTTAYRPYSFLISFLLVPYSTFSF